MTVDPTLQEILLKFHEQNKIIGVCCIAPTIIAKVFGTKLKEGCQLTVGSDDESNKQYPYAGAAGAVKSMGATHTTCEPDKACIDAENKIVSSCAYMYDGLPHEIDDSVKATVDGVLSLM